MKLTKISAAVGLATLAGLASPLVMAEDALGFYGGANVGRTGATIDNARKQ